MACSQTETIPEPEEGLVLYSNFSKDAPVRHGALYNVPVYKIKPNPANPRKNFDEESLRELAASIREVGILQPLVLAENEDGTYRIVAGERRWRAARLAELASVPALIAKLTPAQEAEIMLIENLQRRDLDPIEEAQAYRRLLDECGYTQEALAEKIGVSQPHIANRLRLLRLPETVQEKISRGIISAGHGRELASFKIPAPVLEKVAEKIAQEAVPVARVADRAKVFIGEESMPLFQHWRNAPEFSVGECKDCKHRVMGKEYESAWEEKPYCLNKSCWLRKQDEARRAKVEKAQQKAQKEGYVDLGKLEYGTHYYPWHESDDYDPFDRTECYNCDKRKLGKRQSQRDDEAQLVCTDPRCMDKKRKEHKREKTKLEKESFALEVERIERLAEKVAGGFFEDSEDEFRTVLTKRQLVHLASILLIHIETVYGRNISRYQYLKKRFDWNEDWMKSTGWWSWSQHHGDLLEKLSAISPLELLGIIFAWPAIACGLDGPEGWLLREVGNSEEAEGCSD